LPGEKDWHDFMKHDAALYGGIFGVHVRPDENPGKNYIPAQANVALEEIDNVNPFIAFSSPYEDGPFTEKRGKALVTAASAVAKKYKPEYISLGHESNTLIIFQPDTFDMYLHYTKEAYNAVKSLSPETKVINNFQLEYMKGKISLTGHTIQSHWELLSRFTGMMDAVSFTVYPFLEYTSVNAIPDDYLDEIRNFTQLPVIINETGWPTRNTVTGVTGSDQEQINYMKKLVQQANNINSEIILWVFPHDADFAAAGGIFDNIGLLNNDGSPKPGYEYWKAINALRLY
jgi:hypothetical protein